MTALEGLPAVLSLGPEGMSVELGATLPPEPAPEPLRVSISRRRTLGKCARLYYFEYVLGRRPARESHEQVWGAALHRGLESVYRDVQGAAEHRVALSWELTIRDALAAALTPGLDSEGRPYAPPADPYARAALRAMLRAYAAVWGEHDAAKYEVVAVELPFDLPVITPKGRDSKTARRVGRVDLVVRERPPACEKCGGRGEIGDGMLCPLECFTCKGTGRAAEDGLVWTVEHKSTGKPPGDDVYYRGIEVDPQIATYHDALSIMGYQPAGVLYDVVRRPDYHEPKPAPAMKRCPDCKGSGYVHHAPCSIPECDHEDACPTCQGSGKVPKAARTVECDAEGCDEGTVYQEHGGHACEKCQGKGRITPTVAYSNPRHNERAADYEERIYRLATGADETTEEAVLRRRSEWFGRREFRAGEGPLTSARIQEARLQLWSAAREIRAYQRAGVWPEVGDRYVCAPPSPKKPPCPWFDVCAGPASADDDRLYPLKVRGMVTEGDE